MIFRSYYPTALIVCTLTSTIKNINFLLSEREGRTGEYWCEVMAVRTEHSQVSKKLPRYGSSKRELSSSLLYAACSVTRIFRNLEKGFVRKTLEIMDQESVAMEINSNIKKQL